jgi:hypothetical protein
MAKPKEPYVSSGDRPTLTVDLDTPLTELRVRDLRALLGAGVGNKTPHPKFEGHSPLKEFFDKPFPEVIGPVFSQAPGGGAPIDQLIQTTTNLAKKVDQLADRVAGLEKKLGR